MYHVELREFPHNTHAFNLDAARMHATIVGPYSRGEVFAFAEYEWVPQRTALTILEGPEIPLNQLGLGRGWAQAERGGKDVTEAVLAAARTPTPEAQPIRSRGVEREILEHCAVAPVQLKQIWLLAETAEPEASAGELLVLAERSLGQLLSEGLVEVCRGEGSGAEVLAREEVAALLRAAGAWSGADAGGIFVRAAAPPVAGTDAER
ncbi:MAG: hypothetical protein ABSG64_04460 [Solirubrobacteraceae bacterium]